MIDCLDRSYLSGTVPHRSNLVRIIVSVIFERHFRRSTHGICHSRALHWNQRRACVDACPVDCIHPKKDSPKFATEEMLYIDPVECIDCGACVPVCPVTAIFALDDLPEKWKSYAERNAKYFGR